MNEAAVRERLERERAEVARELAALRDDLGRPVGDEVEEDGSDSHLAESASVTYQRELDVTLSDNAEDLLSRYESALERLAAGRYGLCGDCGRPIDAERLAALPYVDLCIDCARAHER